MQYNTYSISNTEAVQHGALHPKSHPRVREIKYMELKEFVKKVIIDLDTAITEANLETKRDIRFRGVKNERTALEFDVAVTVENSSAEKAGGGIKVLGLIEGGIGGSAEQKNSVVSRVSFGVDIDTYTREENNEKKARNFPTINLQNSSK